MHISTISDIDYAIAQLKHFKSPQTSAVSTSSSGSSCTPANGSESVKVLLAPSANPANDRTSALCSLKGRAHSSNICQKNFVNQDFFFSVFDVENGGKNWLQAIRRGVNFDECRYPAEGVGLKKASFIDVKACQDNNYGIKVAHGTTPELEVSESGSFDFNFISINETGMDEAITATGPAFSYKDRIFTSIEESIMCDYVELSKIESRNSHQTVVVTSGCGLGAAASKAAKVAARIIKKHMEKTLAEDNEIFSSLFDKQVKAIHHAHQVLLKNKEKLGSAEVTLATAVDGYLIVANVGNIKTFIYRTNEKESRCFELHDVKTPVIGSAIGNTPEAKTHQISCGILKLHENDKVVICSKGVYNNLDPVLLEGKERKENPSKLELESTYMAKRLKNIFDLCHCQHVDLLAKVLSFYNYSLSVKDSKMCLNEDRQGLHIEAPQKHYNENCSPPNLKILSNIKNKEEWKSLLSEKGRAGFAAFAILSNPSSNCQAGKQRIAEEKHLGNLFLGEREMRIGPGFDETVLRTLFQDLGVSSESPPEQAPKDCLDVLFDELNRIEQGKASFNTQAEKCSDSQKTSFPPSALWRKEFIVQCKKLEEEAQNQSKGQYHASESTEKEASGKSKALTNYTTSDPGSIRTSAANSFSGYEPRRTRSGGRGGLHSGGAYITLPSSVRPQRLSKKGNTSLSTAPSPRALPITITSEDKKTYDLCVKRLQADSFNINAFPQAKLEWDTGQNVDIAACQENNYGLKTNPSKCVKIEKEKEANLSKFHYQRQDGYYQKIVKSKDPLVASYAPDQHKIFVDKEKMLFLDAVKSTKKSALAVIATGTSLTDSNEGAHLVQKGFDKWMENTAKFGFTPASILKKQVQLLDKAYEAYSLKTMTIASIINGHLVATNRGNKMFIFGSSAVPESSSEGNADERLKCFEVEDFEDQAAQDGDVSKAVTCAVVPLKYGDRVVIFSEGLAKNLDPTVLKTNQQAVECVEGPLKKSDWMANRLVEVFKSAKVYTASGLSDILSQYAYAMSVKRIFARLTKGIDDECGEPYRVAQKTSYKEAYQFKLATVPESGTNTPEYWFGNSNQYGEPAFDTHVILSYDAPVSRRKHSPRKQ